MTLTKYKDLQELFVNCIAYYPGQLNSDGKLADVIGGYHGTITGATRTGTDRFEMTNKTFVYNNNTTVIGNIAALKPTTGFTIIYWTNPNSTSSQGGVYPVIFSCATWGAYYDYLIYFDAGKMKLMIQSASAGSTVQTNTITTGVWQMIAFTYTPNALFGSYVNGGWNNSYNSTSVQIAYTSSNVVIGNYNGTTGQYYSGLIGEILFFDKALTAAQVKSLYNLTKDMYIYPLLSDGVL